MTGHTGAPAGRRPATVAPAAAGERGAVAVELVLLTPLLMAVLCLLLGLGRAADVRGRLTGAVRDAARAASLTATPDQARTAASDTALADLSGAGLECRSPQVQTDTTGWRPGGAVTVTLRCGLDLSMLLAAGLPGHRTVTAHATAPLDTYAAYPAAPAGSR